MAALLPGTMLSLKSSPDTGLWTVIVCTVESYPGPWHQLHMLLLGRSMLSHIDIERGRFREQWDVVHSP